MRFEPLKWQKQAFSRHVPAFDIASAGHSTVTVGCTIVYMRLIQLPGVYNDDRGSHNDVHWSHNDVRASTKLFSLNLCLIWLWIFKGCFVDLGNGFKLTIKTNQRLNWIIISEYYVPTMYIFMIYALIFIAGVLLLCSSLKT